MRLLSAARFLNIYSAMKNFLFSVLQLAVLLISLTANADTSSLCREHSNGRTTVFSNQVNERENHEFSIVTWNAYKLSDDNFLPDLLTLSQDADLFLIQEAMHGDQLAEQLSAQFPFEFSFFKSFCNSDKLATGVMNMARHKLANNRTLVSPYNEPFSATPKVSGYSLIEVPGIGPVHVINTHGLNFNLGKKFAKQIDQVVAFAEQLQGPLIWAGDFNTWSDWRKDHLRKATQKLRLQHLKPAYDTRHLKLDHVYSRELSVKSVDLLVNIRSSDHLPIKVVFEKNQP